ncbi:NAD-dependent epimerase/dehydratase family protein [Comamonas endophytica]|uniref:NAD-dependent epimerase/dehydratase family protein n=1 Tax=Comamonas endophytica TaxID=2949090 RepID=A0ABY6G7E2_9BURK|nr:MULTISPECIES: NAD-dependent epimerase/dehydratase family protein [unclassified Acidovorax]MCD2511568.1 NAD-dependent epimerase/dehydratase family protein [Acidovorax sp. D4N7]UYG50952.1 NAD-dependent epimerase/dehydratase family protein [Acidovorax sp. 5MLIR]
MPSNQNPLGARPARFRRQRLLIVGCGDVGQRVARAVRGVRLLALTSSPERRVALRAQRITPLLGDLDDPRSLRRLAGLGTRVLHLAPPPATPEEAPQWWLDPRTTALVQALRRRTVPQALVYGSTSGVYGDCGGAWVDESRPAAARTGRAMRRVNAERTLRWAGRQGLRASILRIPGIYAPDRAGGTPRTRLLRGTPVLRAEDDVYTNHIHADDLARACIAALWRGRAQRIYNVADASDLRMGDYFDLAADLYGLPRPARVSRSQAQGELPVTLLSFMGESRRLRTTRLVQELRVALRYPHVAQGLQGLPVR